MKIIQNNIKDQNSLTLSPLSKDDIYVLSKIIKKDDKIEAKTSRKLNQENKKTQQRIYCLLEIIVESIDVDLQDGILYVKGKISKTVDRIPLNAYHTLVLSIDQSFVITKTTWSNEEIKFIKDNNKGSSAMHFIIFYEKDVVISSVSGSNVLILRKFEAKKQKFEEIYKFIKRNEQLVNCFITGTTELCNMFFQKFKADLVVKNCFKLKSDYKGIPNTKTIMKILQDRDYAGYFANNSSKSENEDFISFIRGIEKGSELIVIGWKEVNEAVSFNAIKTLFITSDLYKPNDVRKRGVMELFIANVQKSNCNLSVISSTSANGEKLSTIGGIGAIIKYKFK